MSAERHCNRLSKEVVEPFKARLDGASGSPVKWKVTLPMAEGLK